MSRDEDFLASAKEIVNKVSSFSRVGESQISQLIQCANRNIGADRVNSYLLLNTFQVAPTPGIIS